MRFKLMVGPSYKDRKVFLDGVDVSAGVQDVMIRATPEGARVTIVTPSNIEGVVEGEVSEILRRILVEDVDA